MGNFSVIPVSILGFETTLTMKIMRNPAVSVGADINGTITSNGNVEDTVTISPLNGDEEICRTETTDTVYELVAIPSRTYTLKVSKANHVTRTYEITVKSKNIT